MTSISGSSGLASLQAAKQAGDAAFFANLVRKEQIREVAKQEAQKAEEKPVTVSLGGNAVTLEGDAAGELATVLSGGAELFEANPGQSFQLPGGGTATGAELSAALATLILAGKV
jgi:hypothetical protein